ncbi:MAG: hypothetical protein B5M51_08480 [Anaerolinea sp. 4484_236]|nr:MAG: hypothetical protein B5M51_08480 [Anaerolinea sp. 4484_236]
METTNSQQETPTDSAQKKEESKLSKFWSVLTQAGIAERTLRIGTYLGAIILVTIVIFAVQAFSFGDHQTDTSSQAVFAAASSTSMPAPTEIPDSDVEMPIFDPTAFFTDDGLTRAALIHTSIPTRARVDVLTYTVEQGDSVFAIADLFGLKPETILWGNTSALNDNPHSLSPGQELNILPVDGTYHKWTEGESLANVADYYGVSIQSIIGWPGNHFDIYDFDAENPGIAANTMLIIPGGKREMINYGPPVISRSNPAIASTYGPGHCGAITQGAIGIGSFIWPTIERWISGYDYNPGANHPAIDIAGSLGNSVWSVDNGVIVYSGWSNYGYGNLVVVDHGNGWQSLYAHLNSISVGCGQSVYQGTPIGALGSTGNSSGPHLHFELIYLSQRVNPWNFLQ